MARGQAAHITTETRVNEIAAELINGATSENIVRKYSDAYGVTGRQIESYIRKASIIIRERSEKTHGNALQEAVNKLVRATPKAIDTLEKALDSVDESGKPSTSAIRAAAEIIHKALPDNIKVENVEPELSEDEINEQFKAIIDKVDRNRKIKGN